MPVLEITLTVAVKWCRQPIGLLKSTVIINVNVKKTTLGAIVSFVSQWWMKKESRPNLVKKVGVNIVRNTPWIGVYLSVLKRTFKC